MGYSVNMDIETWAENIATITKPKNVYFCDGSDQEYNKIIEEMLERGEITKLNEHTYPGSYLYRSAPTDVARTEKATFICSDNQNDVGPLNNYMSCNDAEKITSKLLRNGMEGKTMYVIPYLMGPMNSRFSELGVEITDSPYVVANMKIMTHMGKKAIDNSRKGKDFIRGIHASLNLDPDNRYILHFPFKRTSMDAHIISLNSAYGGNALLGKKCHALRIASANNRNEDALAEHMLLLEVETPDKEKYYFAAAFPSASGKTNLAMIKPSKKYAEAGWETRLIGDDIAWIRPGKDGRLYAVNPESGFFGVVPGTSMKTNPNAMNSIFKNTIFTNVGLTENMEPWWDDLPDPGCKIKDWRGNNFVAGTGQKAAHPNSRFTTPIQQYPKLSDDFNNPEGVPISGIIFGGRRQDTIPLVYQAFNWEHGVFLGFAMGVEQTAAAEGIVGKVRRDPMAMRPFIGYNISQYLDHWLSFNNKNLKLPAIFYVNWFRKDKDGNYIWPGFGENIRVIEWMIKRINGKAKENRTKIGFMPEVKDIEISGMNISKNNMETLLSIDSLEWNKEIMEIKNFISSLGTVPEEINRQLIELEERFNITIT
jgi:phosphoenolpyruvate carboxykinase (GTP)